MRPIARSVPLPFPQPARLLAWLAAALCALALAPLHAGEQAAPPPPAPSPATYAPMLKQVMPSVVTISTSRTVRMQQQLPPQLDDPILRRFFGFGDDEDQPQRQGRPRRELKQQGLGSGVIISADGYVLTNNHVVEEADEIKVGLNNGQQLDAKLIGRDAKTDVAVLRIDAGKPLPALPIGDSAKVEVGDLVFAVGNPFGVGQTVTMGIISAIGRGPHIISDGYEDFLQTDASINPGNSGGALVDGNGRLVGINTAILSRTGGNLGIGFAVPINLARGVMDSLISKGKVVRGYLGIAIQPVTPELAKAFKLPDENGALVGDVVAGSPAAKAGIKSGDVVVKFGDRTIDSARTLRLFAAQTSPGTTVPVTVIRDGQQRAIDVTLKDLPEDGEGPGARGHGGESHEQRFKLGVRLADVDSEARQRFRLGGDVEGAVIVEVMPDSPAEDAGLKPGDVILDVNRAPVKGAEQATKAIGDAKGDIVLRVQGQEGTRFVVVAPKKAKD